jgi:hypothetical protein
MQSVLRFQSRAIAELSTPASAGSTASVLVQQGIQLVPCLAGSITSFWFSWKDFHAMAQQIARLNCSQMLLFLDVKLAVPAVTFFSPPFCSMEDRIARRAREKIPQACTTSYGYWIGPEYT